MDSWASFTHKLMNSDCSVWKFQASFDLKDVVYASATAWKDIKEYYPMKNLNKTRLSVMFMKYLSKEEFEGCNIKSVPEYLKY